MEGRQYENKDSVKVARYKKDKTGVKRMNKR